MPPQLSNTAHLVRKPSQTMYWRLWLNKMLVTIIKYTVHTICPVYALSRLYYFFNDNCQIQSITSNPVNSTIVGQMTLQVLIKRIIFHVRYHEPDGMRLFSTTIFNHLITKGDNLVCHTLLVQQLMLQTWPVKKFFTKRKWNIQPQQQLQQALFVRSPRTSSVTTFFNYLSCMYVYSRVKLASCNKQVARNTFCNTIQDKYFTSVYNTPSLTANQAHQTATIKQQPIKSRSKLSYIYSEPSATEIITYNWPC